MTLALCILGAIAVLLAAFAWHQYRSAQNGAFIVTEFLHERIRTLDAEREVLLTRIQFYDPNPPKPTQRGADPSRSPADDARPEPDEDEHLKQMQKRGLRSNTDGGYLDGYGHLYGSFAAYDQWIDLKEANKLPDGADPRDFMPT